MAATTLADSGTAFRGTPRRLPVFVLPPRSLVATRSTSLSQPAPAQRKRPRQAVLMSQFGTIALADGGDHRTSQNFSLLLIVLRPLVVKVGGSRGALRPCVLRQACHQGDPLFHDPQGYA